MMQQRFEILGEDGNLVAAFVMHVDGSLSVEFDSGRHIEERMVPSEDVPSLLAKLRRARVETGVDEE